MAAGTPSSPPIRQRHNEDDDTDNVASPFAGGMLDAVPSASGPPRPTNRSFVLSVCLGMAPEKRSRAATNMGMAGIPGEPVGGDEMVVSAHGAEEECKRALNSTIGGHSFNPPQRPKPEAASTAAPAASTASRSPRLAGDSPCTSTFNGLQVVIDLAPALLTQDESDTPAPPPHPRPPPNRSRVISTTPAASKAGHGSMRPRGSPGQWRRKTALSPLRGHTIRAPKGHLLSASSSTTISQHHKTTQKPIRSHPRISARRNSKPFLRA